MYANGTPNTDSLRHSIMGHPLPGTLSEEPQLRPERLKQTVTNAELTLEAVLPNDFPLGELELETSDNSLCLELNGGRLGISFCVPIDSNSATAKFSRKRRTLTLRGPLLATRTASSSGDDGSGIVDGRNSSGSSEELRATIGGLWRGSHLVHISVTAEEVGRRCYVLVTRHERHPTLKGGGYQWCHTFIPSAVGERLSVSIDAYSWVWEPTDALLTYGVLGEDEEPPVIEAGLEQVGVDFKENAASAGTGPSELAASFDGRFALEFVPDESQLPIAELQKACRLYYAAFAAVDGYELAGSYQRTKPPPPRWVKHGSSATEGGGGGGGDGRGGGRGGDDNVIIDTYYSSLTYGEAEFVPLYSLLLAVGVPDGGVLVDLGSGTGRMVLCAALAFPQLREIRGIELVPTLHAGASQALDALHRLHRLSGSAARSSTAAGDQEAPTALRLAPVQLVEGDILTTDWSDADVVIATSLCFPEELQKRTHDKVARLKLGAKVVVMQGDFDCPDVDSSSDDEDDGVAKYGEGAQRKPPPPPPPPRWLRPVVMQTEEPQHEVRMQMSFGMAKFYVYERVEFEASGPAGDLRLLRHEVEQLELS